jgi:hypothetical protein
MAIESLAPSAAALVEDPNGLRNRLAGFYFNAHGTPGTGAQKYQCCGSGMFFYLLYLAQQHSGSVRKSLFNVKSFFYGKY